MTRERRDRRGHLLVRRTRPFTALVLALLLALASCTGGSQRDSQEVPQTRTTPTATATATATATSPATVAPSESDRRVRCAPGAMRSWKLREPTTVASNATTDPYMVPEVVVDRAGKATTVYRATGSFIRTADDPPAPGDPQDPTDEAERTTVDGVSHVTLDERGNLSLAYFRDEDVDALHVTDRSPGGGWSTQATKVRKAQVYSFALAANVSGAAVLSWVESGTSGGGLRPYASYRAAAGGTWSAPERVPARTSANFAMGVDDARRVLLAYSRWPVPDTDGVWVRRRTPDGVWSDPERVGPSNTRFFGMAVSGGGGAVVRQGFVDGNGASAGAEFTTRMSPAGEWGAPQRLPDGFRAIDIGMDKAGRALMIGWEGEDLTGRWSQRDGRWSTPLILADDVPNTSLPAWGLAPQVELNRRGDAVVTWAVPGEDAQAWSRYKPVGGQWTEPVRLSKGDDPPQVLRTAIGECGHVAFTWTTASGPRRLQVVRASPVRKGR